MRSGFLAIGAVAVALGIAALLFSPSRGVGATDPPGDGYGPMWGGHHHMGDLPPRLAFLRQLPPAERFDHFRGGTMTLIDQQGQEVTVNMVPGTISSVSANSVTITPNGQTQGRTFAITGDTRIRATPPPGSIQSLNTGDRVVVVDVSGDQGAAAIMKFPVRGGQAPSMAPGGAMPTPTPGGAAPAPTASPGG